MIASSDTKELYELILDTAWFFLQNAKRFPVELLKLEEDPTFEEIADDVVPVVELVVSAVHEEDPDIAAQAQDYLLLIRQLATAIHNVDQDEVDRVAADLEQKPFFRATFKGGEA